MKILPKSRNVNIVVQTAGKEILIYDLTTHKAYNLNETLTIVYLACDGITLFDELKARNGLMDEIIYLALDELRRENLLEKSEEYNSPFAGMSRREVIRKVGFASIIGLPVISSLIAPTAVMAQSPTCATGISQGQGTCPGGERCVSGFCSACIPGGQSLPGGCTVSTVARCCSSGCNVPSGNCI